MYNTHLHIHEPKDNICLRACHWFSKYNLFTWGSEAFVNGGNFSEKSIIYLTDEMRQCKIKCLAQKDTLTHNRLMNQSLHSFPICISQITPCYHEKERDTLDNISPRYDSLEKGGMAMVGMLWL